MMNDVSCCCDEECRIQVCRQTIDGQTQTLYARFITAQPKMDFVTMNCGRRRATGSMTKVNALSNEEKYKRH